jgi:hypothetical protein
MNTHPSGISPNFTGVTASRCLAMLFMADMPVHPFLLESIQEQILLIAIIAPYLHHSINDPLHRFRCPKINADELRD